MNVHFYILVQVSNIKSEEKFENNSEHTFNIFLFENEEKTKKKIKLCFYNNINIQFYIYKMDYTSFVEHNKLKSKINHLEEEIEIKKNEMNFLWIKHTIYNTTLFIFGVSALTLFIFSPKNIQSIKENIETTIKSSEIKMEKIYWELINQSIYVINGKILIFGNNCL